MVTGAELVELAYQDVRYNRVTTAWVTRAEVSDRRTVTALSARGLPANSSNAQGLVVYFERAIARNGQRLPWVDVAHRCGAIEVDEGLGWLFGDEWIGPDETNIVPNPLNEDAVRHGYGVSGRENVWFDRFAEIADVGDVARWLCFSTFAAPLLRLIRRRTFIIHHWGQTGKGKTALAKFAMSAWGCPQKLTEHFNRTEKSFTELFQHTNDYPICFDELQASTNDDHARIIYQLTLEKGRGRSRKTGGLQKAIDDWHSVVRMTGEEPIIGRGGLNLGGQSNRVIQLNAPGLPGKSAGLLHRWMEGGHFGWGGYRFLERLRAHAALPGGVRSLRACYAKILSELDADERYGPLQDRTGHLAVVAMAQFLAAMWLFGGEKDSARRQALEDARLVAELLLDDHIQNPSTVEQALQTLRDYRDQAHDAWFDCKVEADSKALIEGTYRRVFGVDREDRGEVWLLQSEANKVLRRAGFPTKVVWSDLKRQGHLVPSVDGRNLATIRTAGKFRNRVYVIKRNVFIEPDEEPN
jgi:hypothetical protein